MAKKVRWQMLSRFSLLIIILLAYVYLITHDSDRSLLKKAKTTCKEYCKEIERGEVKVKVNKATAKDKRFF